MIKIEWNRSGQYNKEIGIRLVKSWKSVSIVVGFWKYYLRMEIK